MRFRYKKWLGLLALLVCGFAIGAMPQWRPKLLVKALALIEKRPRSTPLFAVSEHKPFVLIIPSYNNSEWVERNLRAVFEQKYDNYRVIYIDDASTDNTLDKAQKLIAEYQVEHRVQLIHNESNRGATENIYRAVHSCEDGEIVILYDGDDWFAHDRVLYRLNEIYADPAVWVSHGSYTDYPTYRYVVANLAQPLPKKVIKKNQIREFTRKHWYLHHLRTFYAGLFKQIHLEDVLYEGKFCDAAYDVAFMVPMVEMAGKHLKFVDDVLYIYNRATPLNDHKLRFQRQQAIKEHLLSLRPYERLNAPFPLQAQLNELEVLR